MTTVLIWYGLGRRNSSFSKIQGAHFIAHSFCMLDRQTLSKQRLETLLNYMALVVDEYGETYYPIFERFEAELNEIEERERKIKERLQAFN